MAAQHILIALHDFSSGGTELIAFRLARAWVEAGRRVTILAGARDGPLQDRVPAGVNVEILSPERPRSPLSRLSLGRAMAPAAARLQPDAIFLPGNFHFLLARALKAALPRIPIVAKASNPILSGRSLLPDVLLRGIVAQVTRGVDRLVAMADPLRREIERFAAPHAVETIADPFLDDRTQIAARPGTPADSPLRLLCVARLETQKDPLLAIATLAALPPSATLTILGEGPLRPALEAEIARLGLADRVALPGYVSDPPTYYAASDMLLMTSRFEGVPAAIGEALVHGLSFVATDCSPWLRGLAADGKLGTVVATRDPSALAAAVMRRAAEPYPTAGEIERALAPHRVTPAARAYLDLFDRLVAQADC